MNHDRHENFTPPNGPSTKLSIKVTNFIYMWNATIKEEELVYISSYQTLPGAKYLRTYKPRTKP